MLATAAIDNEHIINKNKSITNEPIIRSYGKLSSSESSPDDDVTPDTSFMLASVSKVFVGVAVTKLIELGIIESLDDDICDVIPEEWTNEFGSTTSSACRNPKYPDTPVTWRMLLTHRSSLIDNIPDVYDENGDAVVPEYGPTGGYTYDLPAVGNPTCPLTDVQGFYRDFLLDKETETSVGTTPEPIILEDGMPLNWYQVGKEYGDGAWKNYEPGSKYNYSNFAIGYVAALIELALEKKGITQSFDQYCNEHIFEPLGMDNTRWFREDLPNIDNVAVPVEYDYWRWDEYVDYGHYCYIDYASGQLYSSANDMSLFLNSMLKYGSPTIFESTIGQSMFICQAQDETGNLLNVEECEHGIAWEILHNEGKVYIDEYPEYGWLDAYKDYDWTNGGMHNGLEAGVQTQILVLPNAGVYVAILTNTDSNDEDTETKLASTVAKAARGEITSTSSATRIASPDCAMACGVTLALLSFATLVVSM